MKNKKNNKKGVVIGAVASVLVLGAVANSSNDKSNIDNSSNNEIVSVSSSRNDNESLSNTTIETKITTTEPIITTRATTNHTPITTTKIKTTTEKSAVVYLLNSESMKIHRSNCRTIKHRENFQETTDFDGAINQGYSRCKVCMR